MPAVFSQKGAPLQGQQNAARDQRRHAGGLLAGIQGSGFHPKTWWNDEVFGRIEWC